MEKTEDLIKLEENLKDELRSSEQPWIAISELLLRCRDQELWKGAYKSYSEWLNTFAAENGVTASLLWKRQKAGLIYEEYTECAKSQGIEPVPIDKKCSPETLEFANKICGNNKDKLVKLVSEAAAGQVSRAALERQWKVLRSQKERAGMKAARTSRHDSAEIEELPEEAQRQITAVDIVDALNNPEWLQNEFDIYESWSFKNMRFYRLYDDLPLEDEREIASIKDPRFRLNFTEFRTGKEETSERVRRMDYAIVENHTCEDPNMLRVHGFEIKVTPSDLEHDTKMGDYTSYCNTFWLVVPEDMANLALSYAAKTWGVIAVDRNKKVTVLKSASLAVNPKYLNRSLMTVIEKQIVKKH